MALSLPNSGADVTVSTTAVSLIAVNPARVSLILSNVSANGCRVGAASVTATTGLKLAGNTQLVLNPAPTTQVFAIRDAAADAVVNAQEIVNA